MMLASIRYRKIYERIYRLLLLVYPDKEKVTYDQAP